MEQTNESEERRRRYDHPDTIIFISILREERDEEEITRSENKQSNITHAFKSAPAQKARPAPVTTQTLVVVEVVIIVILVGLRIVSFF